MVSSTEFCQSTFDESKIGIDLSREIIGVATPITKVVTQLIQILSDSRASDTLREMKRVEAEDLALRLVFRFDQAIYADSFSIPSKQKSQITHKATTFSSIVFFGDLTPEGTQHYGMDKKPYIFQ